MINLPKVSLVFLICTCLILVQSTIMFDDALARGKSLPPRPGGSTAGGSVGGGSQGNGGHGDSEDGLVLGDIYGELIDQSTGLPGAGLTVMINDIPIKTDASGRFSLTGIDDGIYIVNLSLPPEFTPAQSSQTVIIANRERVDISLGYYSQTPPSKDSSVADSFQQIPSQTASDDLMAANFVPPPLETASFEDFPDTMPQTGGESSSTGFAFLVYLLGILLWTFGTVQFLLWVAP